MNKINLLTCLLLIGFCFLFNCSQHAESEKKQSDSGPIKVELRNVNGRYFLLRDRKPFTFNGAGLEFGDMEKLAQHGGTSIRTWRTDNGQETGQQVLDRALANGLTVTMCLEVARERHGFDYNDTSAVQAQFMDIKKQVLRYKDHPALIIWAIGNELNLGFTNPRVYDAVNDLSKMIHQVDPYHLTTSTTAGINKDLVDIIKQRAPDLDLLSVQSYGDIVNLPKYIRETGWTKPYMVTEWGATGHWEVDTTTWGAPIEQNSSAKARSYLDRYKVAIEPFPHQCVGSYVFLWGQKQERTPTWYGMFLKSGEETETVDVMHYIWNHEWPENRSPGVVSMFLDGKSANDDCYLTKNSIYSAQAKVKDPDGDPLTFSWVIMEESKNLGDGGDKEAIPQQISGLIEDPTTNPISLHPPDQAGAYRLYMYAFDGQGHAAYANIPFYVRPK